MFSRMWLINVILLLLLSFFGVKAYGVWFQGNTEDKTPEIAGNPVQKTLKPVAAPYERKISPETKYDDLLTLNLFHPDRTETILGAPKPDEKSKKLSAAEQKNMQQYFSNLTLYGLVITDDSAEALVSYPVAKPVLKGRKTTIPKNTRRKIQRLTAKRTQWVKAGDTLGDFKVVSIKPDRVVLKAGEQSYDLLLYDKDNLKKRAAPKPKTGPNVVGVSIKPKAGSKVAKVPVKSPVVNTKGQSTIPFPTKKEASGAAVTKTQRNQ